MWYIEWVGVKPNYGKGSDTILEVPFLYYNSDVRQTNSVFIKLRNTETDETAELHGFPWKKFESGLRNYHPYGWILGGKDSDDATLIKVDKLSLDFLDLVKNVELIEPADIKFVKFAKSLRYQFTFLDEGMTFVYCSSLLSQNAFTLLQVMCFLQEGWYKGKFYLKWGAKVYSIEFFDSDKAHDFVLNALSKGYNPMQDVEGVR